MLVTPEDKLRERIQLFASDFAKKIRESEREDIEALVRECTDEVMQKLSFSDMLSFFVLRSQMGVRKCQQWVNEALTEVLIAGIENPPETLTDAISNLSKVLTAKSVEA